MYKGFFSHHRLTYSYEIGMVHYSINVGSAVLHASTVYLLIKLSST
ncbi:hypothetical protein CZ794_05830 [Psychrobacter sp. JB385]|nr:hypothetical protein CZ794_05830 [Psychrobacter sp. JB385]